MSSPRKKVVLAFSGGLDTTAIVPWLQENHGADVIAYCSDLGNAPDAAFLKDWSKKLGVVEFIFEDVKERFATDFVLPALRAGANYQDDYLLGTAIARPLISERVAHFAKEFKADAIAHGATGKGNDQIRFERSWAYLCPDLELIAPWKVWEYTGRKDLLNYLSKRGIQMESTEKKYSVDVNLLHRSCEGGILESPSDEFNPSEIYEWVKPPAALAGSTETRVVIDFKKGIPVSVNGKSMSPASLLGELNALAGAAGVGVLDLVEERTNGIKSRGIYETPGGTVLAFAVKQLKHLSWDRSLQTTARYLGQQYGELIYDGLWHSESRPALEAFFERASETLTGQVVVKLQAGQIRAGARSSPFSLYDEKSVTFEKDDDQMHKHALGYCKTLCAKQKMAGRRDVRNQRAVK